jgi:hypothetical protein
MKKLLVTPSARLRWAAGLFAAQPAAAGTIVVTSDDLSPPSGNSGRHSGKYWLLWLAFALVLSFAQSGRAAPVTIVSLSYIHLTSATDCEDTIPGDPCSAIGVTNSGATTNPFLNNTSTKAINLGHGSYYTFGIPYGGTDFMIQGDSITAKVVLSNGTSLSNTTTVQDLSIAGTPMFDFAASGVSIVTTGITGADRMSFGYPPGAFTPGGYSDFVLELDYFVPIPEPATWTMMLAGLLCLGGVMHSRRQA